MVLNKWLLGRRLLQAGRSPTPRALSGANDTRLARWLFTVLGRMGTPCLWLSSGGVRARARGCQLTVVRDGL